MHDGKRWRRIVRDCRHEERARLGISSDSGCRASAKSRRFAKPLKMREINCQDEDIDYCFITALFASPNSRCASLSGGQWIRFHQDYRSLRVHRGDYRRIERIDQKTNELLLANDDRENPALGSGQSAKAAIEVFDEKNRAIAVGDTLICHRTNKKQGLVKGERVTVTAITEKQIEVLKQ